MNTELLEALTILEEEKDISKETMLDAIENSLMNACKNHFGKADNIKIIMNRETCDYSVFAEKVVVEEVEDEVMEISLAEKLNERGEQVTFLGDGVPVYKEQLEQLLHVPVRFAPSHMNRQRAAAVGTLAVQYWKEGKIERAEDHQPDYLRMSQAERERLEREEKEQQGK